MNYSHKLLNRVERPHSLGFFKEGDAPALRLAVGKGGSLEEGQCVALYCLFDKEDGVVVDAKFQAFGGVPLIAAADSACGLIVGKNHDQMRRVTAELLDKGLRDKEGVPAFPKADGWALNLVLSALDSAAEQVADLPLASHYVSPVPRDQVGKESGGYPGWLTLPKEKKLTVIEDVLTEEVRPYIELDEGGIEVLDLIDDKELLIAYKGSCTSCYSAIGATLLTIQEIVSTRIHPEIKVVPNMDDLQF